MKFTDYKKILTAVLLSCVMTGLGLSEDSNSVVVEEPVAAMAADQNSAVVDVNAAVDGNNASAQVETAVVEVNEVPAATKVENTEVTSADLSSGDIQSLTFKRDMSIRDALRFLAAQYHRNIVPSLKVDGPIPITSLYDVTFDEALIAICGKDFRYNEEGGFIKVYTYEEWKKIQTDIGRMEHRVFTLYYITAEDAAKLITPLKSEFGFIAVSTAAEKEISGSTSNGANIGGSIATTGGGDSMAINDTIVMRDFPEYLDKAADVLSRLDTRPKQVLVEATILSATLTEGLEFGIDFSFLNGITSSGRPNGTPIATEGFSGTESGNGLTAIVTSGDFTAVITALESITDTTILANPKILAVNKQEGSMLIGKNLGYRSSTTIGQGGVATEGEVKFLKSGTQLVFRPYIGNDGYIRMEIYPKDSTAALDRQTGVPTEITTELKTNIMVRDGETIVLGGLFRDEMTTGRQQVPILGDIPLIGLAFRGTNDTLTKQEVIILLTPHIIDAAGQTNGEARANDVSRKRYGAMKEMQFFGRARMAQDRYIKAVDYYYKGDKAKALVEAEAILASHPTSLDAMRLKDKIVRETAGEDCKVTKRIMIDMMDREESTNWLKR